MEFLGFYLCFESEIGTYKIGSLKLLNITHQTYLLNYMMIIICALLSLK